MNVPNVITIARILAVPVLIWLIVSGEYLWSFWLFVLAGLSDGVDGFIAKRFDQRTQLGAYLDPLADKLMLVSIYVSLGLLRVLPPWLVILVVARDIMIVGGVVLATLLEQPVKVQPLLLSKLNTGTQIVLAGLVMAVLGFGLAAWTGSGQGPGGDGSPLDAAEDFRGRPHQRHRGGLHIEHERRRIDHAQRQHHAPIEFHPRGERIRFHVLNLRRAKLHFAAIREDYGQRQPRLEPFASDHQTSSVREYFN